MQVSSLVGPPRRPLYFENSAFLASNNGSVVPTIHPRTIFFIADVRGREKCDPCVASAARGNVGILHSSLTQMKHTVRLEKIKIKPCMRVCAHGSLPPEKNPPSNFPARKCFPRFVSPSLGISPRYDGSVLEGGQDSSILADEGRDVSMENQDRFIGHLRRRAQQFIQLTMTRDLAFETRTVHGLRWLLFISVTRDISAYLLYGTRGWVIGINLRRDIAGILEGRSGFT